MCELHAVLLDAKLCKHYQPVTVSPQKYLKMSADMHRFVFGPDSVRYLREVNDVRVNHSTCLKINYYDVR